MVTRKLAMEQPSIKVLTGVESIKGKLLLQKRKLHQILERETNEKHTTTRPDVPYVTLKHGKESDIPHFTLVILQDTLHYCPRSLAYRMSTLPYCMPLLLTARNLAYQMSTLSYHKTLPQGINIPNVKPVILHDTTSYHKEFNIPNVNSVMPHDTTPYSKEFDIPNVNPVIPHGNYTYHKEPHILHFKPFIPHDNQLGVTGIRNQHQHPAANSRIQQKHSASSIQLDD